jgi:tRNA1(Val) A37 N6-methylase TrmN6
MNYRTILEKDYPGYELFTQSCLDPVFGPMEKAKRSLNDYLSGGDKTIVKDLFIFGSSKNFTFGEMNFFDVTLHNHVDIARSRVTIQRAVKKSLDDYQAAIVVFHYADNSGLWRFSFINRGDSAKHTTPAKRYSYLCGKGRFCRTLADNLEKLQTIQGIKSLVNVTDVFSIEALTEEFFKRLFKWYDTWAVDIVRFPVGIGKAAHVPAKLTDETKKANRQHLIRLITRLIFVWFLRHKENLIPDWIFDIKELREIISNFDAHSSKSGSYYNAVLQNLFFATLNCEINKRKFFDGDDGKDRYGIKSTYRDHIDKPMLHISHGEFIKKMEGIPFLNGGLFECLDSRDGREEQEYKDGFSRESKGAAFVPNCLFFGDSEGQEGLIDIFSQYNFTIEENTPQDIEIALDPELLGKVFENLLATYDEKTERPARKESGSFYTPREVVDYMVNSSLKAYLKAKIKNKNVVINNIDSILDALFQDDVINMSLTPALTAVFIEAIKACKILDPACGSGAFLMGILNKMVYILNKIDPDNKTWKDHYNRKLYLIENCIYGVDLQPIAIQISKLRFFISLITEQSINKAEKNLGLPALPNLETKFVAANTLVRLSRNEEGILPDLEIEKVQKQLLERRHEHFMPKNNRDKDRIRKEDHELSDKLLRLLESNGVFSPESVKQISAWNPYEPNKPAPFFDMYWMFFIKSGFDIVIGNPPYFVIKNDEKMKPKYEKLYPYLKSGRVNIYQLFFGCSAQLLSESGVLTFIHPKTLLSDAYLSATRYFLLSYFQSFDIINIVSRTDTFGAVLQSVVVTLWNKSKEEKCRVTEIFKKSEFEVISFLSLSKDDIVSIHKTLLVSGNSGVYRIEKKLRQIETLPLNFVTGSIEWNKYSSYLSSIKNPGSKRLVYGENIQRFYIAESRSRIETTFLSGKVSVPILAGPAIFTQRTTAVEQPYRVIASIVDPKRFDTPIVSENGTNIFVCNDTQTSYYILGILNSKLMDFYFRLFNSNTHVSSTELNRLPIIKPSKEPLNAVKTIVQKICHLKEGNPGADTTGLERQLDNLVYRLYNLTWDEIRVIEPGFPLGRAEYEGIEGGSDK